MILTIYNSKGGTAKTTTAVNLAVSLAVSRRVLLVDLDGQYSATSYFLDASYQPELSIYDLIFSEASPANAPVEVSPTLSVIAGEGRMVNADALLPNTVTAPDLRLSRVVKEGLKSGWKFDDIIFDVPSNWGATARNALIASSHHLLTINSEQTAFDVAQDTWGRTQGLFELYDRQLPETGILITAFDGTVAAKDIETKILEFWPGQTLQTRIRFTKQIRDLARERKTVAQRQAGTARADYMALCAELKKKKWLQQQQQRNSNV